MIIRKTRMEELEEVMCIYARAVEYMAQTGNPNQWTVGYPSREMIESDIQNGVSYVADVNGRIEAVFVYAEGVDPTYGRIDNGAWKVFGPYATIHRIASAGRIRGIGRQCIVWCEAQAASHGCGSLRADTHEDNRVMQHVLSQGGFLYCGIIYLEDGSMRLAYEKPLWQNSAMGNVYQKTPQKGEGIGFGVASMVLGIISLLLFCTCMNFLTGILAIIFGILQLMRNKEKAFAITGIVTAVLSMILGILLAVVFFVGMQGMNQNSYDDIFDYYYHGDEFYHGDYMNYDWEDYGEERGEVEFF